MSWEAAVNTDDPQADGNLIAAHCQNVVSLPLKRFVCVIVVDRNTKYWSTLTATAALDHQ